MNKQEAIEKINNMSTLKINDTISHQQIDMVVKNQVLDIISQIDESQKVVVPQFVADWLEVCKENLGFGLLNAMSHSTSAMNKQPNWVKRWFNFKDNQETFAKAWLFGYEVEKEKLYTVEIPDPNGLGKHVLVKGIKGDVFIGHKCHNDWREVSYYQLTESEIKEDFEWAWPFAKEVKE